MKPLHRIVMSLLFVGFISSTATAQKRLTEGVLQYKISIGSSKPGVNNISGFDDAQLSVYLKPNSSRAEMKSSLGTESTVYNNRLSSGFILKEYSGQKLMISLTAANWAQKNSAYENLDFTISPQTSTIAGYTVKKATATRADGQVFTVYFDPSVSIVNNNYNNSFTKLPGLPIQYDIQSGDLTFTYTLTSVSYETVPNNKFEAPKAGYRVMTYEENQQLRKQPGS